MKAVIQRVSRASVTVEGTVMGDIERGILILLGISREDGEEEARILARRCSALRIFDDDHRLMNLGLEEVGGEILVISQFTLLGNCRKGRRPSFTQAAPSDIAEPLVKSFINELTQRGYTVHQGVFGARMEVSLINDGPVTLILDTDELKKSRRGSTGAVA